MKARQFAGIVGLLAVGALAVWTYLSRPPPSGVLGDLRPLRPAISPKVASVPRSAAPAETAAPPATPCSSAAKCGVATLAGDMRDMRDARAFAIAAWEHPERGGVFYAEYVTRTCKSLLRTLDVMSLAQPASDVSSESRIAAGQALARAQRLCGQFTKEELEKYSLASSQRPSSTGDRFFALTAKLTQVRVTGEPAAQRDAVAEILRADDPLLLDQMLIRIVASPQGLYFQGKYYKDAGDRESLLAAIRLVPCDLGLSCDGADLSMLAGCISQGKCYASRLEQAREFYGSDAQQLDRIMKLKNEVTAAIQARNADAFLAKP